MSGIIIITTQVLSIGLRKLRQPRAIAEVLGGILLGATRPFLAHSSAKPLPRPDCLWSYTRVYRTHIPLPVSPISLSCCQHRTLSIPLYRRSGDRHGDHPSQCASLCHRRCSRDHHPIRIRSRVCHSPLSPLHRRVSSVVRPFYALHRRCVLDHGVPRAVPHSDGAQAARHDCWDSGAIGWSWQ